ncbi:putative toxin-antitoxin system toxin component, PIN family [Rhodanobacter umsongensis]|uniref:Toxin-antitoxin system toxin component, PIN family n=1 Tax=Rhodanobacter umsongensis TaxID=633153 RepID=A0ABW0JN31_9GAMM
MPEPGTPGVPANPSGHAAMHRVDTSVPLIVLDTNVCLDLFVFRDPLCSHLLAALQRGAVQAVTREDCRDEWQRVLHYPQLPIDGQQRPALVAAFDAVIRLLPPEASALRDGAPALPRCADPDDQKFLELALASGARWLLSKDKELLKLDRRTRGAGLFAIRLPQLWSIAELRPRAASPPD